MQLRHACGARIPRMPHLGKTLRLAPKSEDHGIADVALGLRVAQRVPARPRLGGATRPGAVPPGTQLVPARPCLGGATRPAAPLPGRRNSSRRAPAWEAQLVPPRPCLGGATRPGATPSPCARGFSPIDSRGKLSTRVCWWTPRRWVPAPDSAGFRHRRPANLAPGDGCLRAASRGGPVSSDAFDRLPPETIEEIRLPGRWAGGGGRRRLRRAPFALTSSQRRDATTPRIPPTRITSAGT
jgi:hypothetical protein